VAKFTASSTATSRARDTTRRTAAEYYFWRIAAVQWPA
jgi:hypothetical protein